MILLWGLRDTAMAAVADALAESGQPACFVDQRRVPITDVELLVDGQVSARVTVGSDTIDLDVVTAAYIRPYETSQLPPEALTRGTRHAQRCADILWEWADVAAALVVNRPTAMAGCLSKPQQLLGITVSGFEVPKTLLTTDPAEVEDFWGEHSKVIYKSTSSVRSIVASLTDEHRPRFPDLVTCPTQFQEHVAGSDYRVHVVGQELFCCGIISREDDYRYPSMATNKAQIYPTDLPHEISMRCHALSVAMKLPLAGIDLRRTPDGRWYCFEVNPSPAFTYYDRHPSKPIAAAVARLLTSAN